jgi:hypothetical protein
MEKLVPSVYGENDGDVVEDFEEPKKGVKTHGPVKMRSMSNGQIRRMMQRQQATQQRKNAVSFRRRWMDNRLAVAVLRGQLEVLDKRSVPAIERDLVAKFGSVDEARAKYAQIIAEAKA